MYRKLYCLFHLEQKPTSMDPSGLACWRRRDEFHWRLWRRSTDVIGGGRETGTGSMIVDFAILHTGSAHIHQCKELKILRHLKIHVFTCGQQPELNEWEEGKGIQYLEREYFCLFRNLGVVYVLWGHGTSWTKLGPINPAVYPTLRRILKHASTQTIGLGNHHPKYPWSTTGGFNQWRYTILMSIPLRSQVLTHLQRCPSVLVAEEGGEWVVDYESVSWATTSDPIPLTYRDKPCVDSSKEDMTWSPATLTVFPPKSQPSSSPMLWSSAVEDGTEANDPALLIFLSRAGIDTSNSSSIRWPRYRYSSCKVFISILPKPTSISSVKHEMFFAVVTNLWLRSWEAVGRLLGSACKHCATKSYSK